MGKDVDDMTRGEAVIAFIEDYCVVPEGMLTGQPVKLADFQRRFILDVYDNPDADTLEAFLSIAKKNSKTSFIAMLTLVHLVGPEAVQNSQLASGAQSRDQAAQVFNYAAKMVELKPELSEIVRIVASQKMLVGLMMNTVYRALSAQATTAHGGSPLFLVIDEVGQVKGPQDDFIDALVSSQGAHARPLRIYISTQAANDADLFSVLLDDAQKTEDPRVVCHIYRAPEGCDLLDEDAWHAANPALGLFRSLDDLRFLAEQAVRMPSKESAFRNLNLNQRVRTTAPFVSASVWKSCGGTPLPLENDPACPIFAGLDLSAHTDLTACVFVQRRPDGLHVWPLFWTPELGLLERARRDRVPYEQWVREGLLKTTPGATVDYECVLRDIVEFLDGVDIEAMAYDRWRIDVFQKEMERLGINLPLVPFGQGFRSMAPALDTFEAELLNGRMHHGMHPVLTMCAANAAVQMDPASNRKFSKDKANGRIDGMQAAGMAIGAMAIDAPDSGPSVYERRGILSFG